MQTLPEIKNQLSRTELFDAFKKQLAKDFQQSNFAVEFVDALEPEYSTIHQKIVFELQRNENNADLMNLLYRVDISEAQLKRYLGEAKEVNHFSVLSELIIKRELQKVVIKQYYKSKDQKPINE